MWRSNTANRIFAAIILVVILCAGISQTAAAQGAAGTGDAGAINLTTSPLPVGLTAKPGQTVTADLRVMNSGTKNEDIQVSLLKFSANNDQGQPRLHDREPGDDYFDWVNFSEKRFVAEPKVWKTIKMTIKVPKTAQLGYYYAVVFQRAQPPGQTDTGASVAGGAASLVLLEVPSPNTRREVKITEFTSKKRIYEFLPSTFSLKIRNTGNVHLVPAGSLFISKGNKELATVNVNPGRGNVLPSSDRVFSADWAEGFPSYKAKIQDGKEKKDKDGNTEYTLTWNFAEASKFRFGKFKATAYVIYDDGTRDVPVEATVEFWVIPWRIIGALLLIALLIFFAVFTIIRKMYRGAKRLGGRGSAKKGKEKTPKDRKKDVAKGDGPDHV